MKLDDKSWSLAIDGLIENGGKVRMQIFEAKY